MNNKTQCICCSDCPHHGDSGQCENLAVKPTRLFWKFNDGPEELGPVLGICQACFDHHEKKRQG